MAANITKHKSPIIRDALLRLAILVVLTLSMSCKTAKNKTNNNLNTDLETIEKFENDFDKTIANDQKSISWNS